jgi:D-glycero-alpha-D-manno-heptose-7-phosphate kinase
MMVYVGKSRMSDGILDEQIRLYKTQKEKMLPYYHEAVRLAVEIKNTLLREDMHDFAELLNQAYENKNHFCDKILSDRIAEVYKLARANGALGGRIMGAGGGGFMLFYVDHEKKRDLIKKLKDIGCEMLNFAFETNGMKTWRIQDNSYK